MVPAFDGEATDVTIRMPRVLKRAGIDRHRVDGAATRTGIFTAVAASHARFEFLSHKEADSAPCSTSQVVSFAAKRQTTNGSGTA